MCFSVGVNDFHDVVLAWLVLLAWAELMELILVAQERVLNKRKQPEKRVLDFTGCLEKTKL